MISLANHTGNQRAYEKKLLLKPLEIHGQKTKRTSLMKRLPFQEWSAQTDDPMPDPPLLNEQISISRISYHSLV